MIRVDLVSRNDQPPVLNSPHMVYNFTENGPPVPFDRINLTDADSDVDDQKANLVEVWIADQLNEPDEVFSQVACLFIAALRFIFIAPLREHYCSACWYYSHENFSVSCANYRTIRWGSSFKVQPSLADAVLHEQQPRARTWASQNSL